MSTAQKALANCSDGTTFATTPTTYTITLPTVVDGDIAVATFQDNSGSLTLTTPAGWTLQSGPDPITTAQTSWLFTKVLTAADSGTTVSFTLSASARAMGHLEVVSGGTMTGFQFAKTIPSGAGTSITVPTLTGVPAGSYLGLHLPRRLGSGAAPTQTIPAPWTNDQRIATAATSTANLTSNIAHQIAATAGTYGGETVTSDVSSAGTAYLVAIPPAASSGLAFVASVRTANSGDTNASIVVPAGVVTNHLGILTIETSSQGMAAMAVPSGWTLRGTNPGTGTQTGTMYVFTRLGGVKAGDTVTATLPISVGATTTAAWYDTGGRDIEFVSSIYNTASADVTTVTFPAPGHSGTRDVILVAPNRTNNANTLPAPAGVTLDVNGQEATWFGGAFFGHALGVTSQVYTGTWSPAGATSHNVNAMQFALTAAVGGTPARSGKAKVWDGTQWVQHPVKTWSGTAWVVHPIKAQTASGMVTAK